MRVPIDNGWFDESIHAYYTVDGLRVPSLTQVLKFAGLTNYGMIDDEVLANAARRGSEVHSLADSYNREGLDGIDPAWITPETRPYFSAYLKFIDETGFIPDPAWSERPMIATVHNLLVGVTPDIFGRLGRDKALFEIKCASAVQDSWSIQTAIQEMAIFKSNHVGRVRRFALQLFNDGRYKMHPHTEHQEDEADGIAALRLTWRRLKRGQKLFDGLVVAY